MKLKSILSLSLIATFLLSCGGDTSKKSMEESKEKEPTAFNYNVEQFADIKILRYQIPGWENLTL